MTFNYVCHKYYYIKLRLIKAKRTERMRNTYPLLQIRLLTNYANKCDPEHINKWVREGGRVNFLLKLKVFRSEQSPLPGELATTFIASLEAPKIELLYKENDATKFKVNN